MTDLAVMMMSAVVIAAWVATLGIMAYLGHQLRDLSKQLRGISRSLERLTLDARKMQNDLAAIHSPVDQNLTTRDQPMTDMAVLT